MDLACRPRPRGQFAVLAAGATLLAATILGACSPAVTISRDGVVPLELQRKTFAQLVSYFNRRSRVTPQLFVSATLWDLSLIRAYLEEQAASRLAVDAQVEAALERWRKRYIDGQTSFAVRIQAEERPLFVQGRDDLVDLQRWTFNLVDDQEHVVRVQRIDVDRIEKAEQAILPESSPSGKLRTLASSYRITGTLHFPRLLARSAKSIQLRAVPPDGGQVVTLTWVLE